MIAALIRTTTALGLAVGLSLFATPAWPADADPGFGQHVQSCARDMGFDGDMNPGMHTGLAGWDPSHTC